MACQQNHYYCDRRTNLNRSKAAEGVLLTLGKTKDATSTLEVRAHSVLDIGIHPCLSSSLTGCEPYLSISNLSCLICKMANRIIGLLRFNEPRQV